MILSRMARKAFVGKKSILLCLVGLHDPCGGAEALLIARNFSRATEKAFRGHSIFGQPVLRVAIWNRSTMTPERPLLTLPLDNRILCLRVKALLFGRFSADRDDFDARSEMTLRHFLFSLRLDLR